MKLTHLQCLEAESIHIMREVVAECERPVMLYSVGKDSATMLHLARKAFYPAPPPFPLLHVDTTWKFREMYALRDQTARDSGMALLVWHNPEAVAKGINPFDHGSQIHTDLWKTQGLKQALDHYCFDAAFGGARRDEEKSRAKERIFSVRNAQHRWDPKNQRPELWSLYNTRLNPGESLRVFPISNWTELDIWQYIHMENIPVVPLYLARHRPVVDRSVAEYQDFAQLIGNPDVTAIPLSALKGDNMLQPSSHTPWYHGPTLMGYLETVPADIGGVESMLVVDIRQQPEQQVLIERDQRRVFVAVVVRLAHGLAAEPVANLAEQPGID